VEGLTEVLAIADDLYGLLPEAFTAARDERVRHLRRDSTPARALAVKELRRPSVAAWLVNALVRHRPDQVEQLLAVGTALREAQQNLDAEQLRELGRQRQAVIAAIGREARGLARDLGRPISESVADEVEETLRAALADPAAASAVRSGRLTTSLRYAGFGELDVSDAVALPLARPTALRNGAGPGAVEEPAAASPEVAAHAAARREAARSVKAAEDAARQSQGTALVAEQHRDDLRRRAGIARERLDKAHARVAELESQLASARSAASTAAAAWAPVHAEAESADVRADAARGVAERARAMLESARRHLAGVEDQGR
jgi:hypothetical protein